MSDTLTLKERGFLERRELMAQISSLTHVHADTVDVWLTAPINKVRSMLVYRGDIVLPDDREWACLYSPKLVVPFVAYMRWHRSGGRRSVAGIIRFFENFATGESEALKHLPPRLRKQEERNRQTNAVVYELPGRRRRRTG